MEKNVNVMIEFLNNTGLTVFYLISEISVYKMRYLKFIKTKIFLRLFAWHESHVFIGFTIENQFLCEKTKCVCLNLISTWT